MQEILLLKCLTICTSVTIKLLKPKFLKLACDPKLFIYIYIHIYIYKGKSDPVTGPVWPRGWVEV